MNSSKFPDHLPPINTTNPSDSNKLDSKKLTVDNTTQVTASSIFSKQASSHAQEPSLKSMSLPKVSLPQKTKTEETTSLIFRKENTDSLSTESTASESSQDSTNTSLSAIDQKKARRASRQTLTSIPKPQGTTLHNFPVLDSLKLNSKEAPKTKRREYAPNEKKQIQEIMKSSYTTDNNLTPTKKTPNNRLYSIKDPGGLQAQQFPANLKTTPLPPTPPSQEEEP